MGNAFNHAKLYLIEYHSLEMKYLHELLILHMNKFSTLVASVSFFSNLAKCYLHHLLLNLFFILQYHSYD